MSERTEYQQKYRQDRKATHKRAYLVLTTAEHRELSRGADAAGMKLAAYVKRLAMAAHSGSGAALVPEEVTSRLDELERLIRNVANNVNQMARHSNVIEEVLDEHEVFGHILSLENALRDTIADMAALGSRPSGSADEKEEAG